MIRDKFTNERGQVGIGTLIVFIALVLVAAIAAGVLINTAGFLQTQAEQTGQDSTDQVADNINVIGEVGEVTEADDIVDGEDPGIFENRLTVQRSAGSGDIDLTGLSIQYVGDNGFAQFIHISEQLDEDPLEKVYFVQEITAESDEDAVITDDGDRYEIVIPVGVTIEEAGDGTPSDITADGTTILDGSNADEIYSDEGTDVEVDLSEIETDTANINNEVDLDLMAEGDSASLEITTDAGATRNVAISAPDTLINEEGETVTL